MEIKDTLFPANTTLNLSGRLFDLSQPVVAGIVNLTPDSFYKESRYSEYTALKVVEEMVAEGADFIDIGGCSTRPGAEEISEEEERRRVIPVIRSVKKEFPLAQVSVDTFRSSIALEAVDEGAVMINDASGGEADPDMFEAVARAGVPYILMHTRGTPRDMHLFTDYEDIFKDIFLFFDRKIANLRDKGVKDIIIDPGFGFAKNLEQGYALLKNLDLFNILGLPVMVGFSRKSMIRKVLHCSPEEALNGTTVLNTIALTKGAKILRVHDVREASEVVKLFNKMNR